MLDDAFKLVDNLHESTFAKLNVDVEALPTCFGASLLKSAAVLKIFVVAFLS